ncbi:hypothetical protein JTB14_018974 [Gonioctena quinquepunctata]|nr:hypothetical protein JTB14_018974 [Gonioctena quinquepunctata]
MLQLMLKVERFYKRWLRVEILLLTSFGNSTIWKKTTELIEILKQGHEVFISKILKQSWFFDEAFKQMDADKLVNDFLPCMSYSKRMKFINKLSNSWNDSQIDVLYDSLKKRYGIFLANTIIHRCSITKIRKELEENEIKLRTNQVKYVFDKDLSLFRHYLDHINSLSNHLYCEEKVLDYMALKNPSLFLELQKNKKIYCSQLGRRTTKKIIKLAGDDIPKDIRRYVDLLNKSVLVRKLGSEFKKVYQQLFPKKMEKINMYSTENGLLMLYPKSRRWDLFSETFSKAFPGKNIEEIFVDLSTSFFKLNPRKEMVEKWAEINYESDKANGERFLKYFDPSKSIPLIRERINVTSDIDKRTTLVMLLLETCAENRDLKALEGILKYICYRHRNEDADFRQTLLLKIKTSFKLEDFNETHWNYVNEVLKIDRTRNEFKFWVCVNLLEKHLEYLFKNKKDHASALMEYMTDVVDSDSQFDICLNNPPIEREILTEICRRFSELSKSNDFEKYFKRLLRKVVIFSMEHPELCVKLTDFPAFVSVTTCIFSKKEGFDHSDVDFIRNVLKYYFKFPQYTPTLDNARILELYVLLYKDLRESCLSDFIRERVLRKNRSEFENQVLTIYLEKLLKDHIERYIVCWLLTNEPRTLMPYFDVVLRDESSSRILDFRQLSLYSHFELDKKTCDFYKKQLDEKSSRRLEAMQSLITLLPTEDYILLVNKLLPKKDKIDLEDEEMMEVYKLQSEVAKILYKVKEPNKMLPVVMKFCVGDYLKSALPALYGVFYRSSEKLLYPYVEHLAKGAVSVRKHAVFLSCQILDQKHVLDILKNTKVSHVSDQKHLFSATSKYFLRNPSQELLDRVVASMEMIDKSDTESLESLKNIQVPRKYKILYIEKCWGFFEHLKKEIKVDKYLEDLLRYISKDVVKAFSGSFIKGLINCYLGTDEHLQGFERFAMEALKYRVPERKVLFDLVFERIHNLSRDDIQSFVQHFIDVSEDQGTDREFIDTFVEYWNKNFTVVDALEEHMSVRLFLMKLEHKSGEELAKNVVLYLDELILQFGLHVFEIFIDRLECFLLSMEKLETYSFFLNILRYKCNASTCILVLKQVKGVDEDDEKQVVELYREILEILKNSSEPIVKVFFKYVQPSEIPEIMSTQ